jgi:uncharacterized protein YdeI (YjbR/CyaY-like superfamily)
MRSGGMTPPGTYEVDIQVDTAERTVDVPADLWAAITTADLVEAWERQSYTNRKEFARGVDEAKKPETRSRRIAKVVDTLTG